MSFGYEMLSTFRIIGLQTLIFHFMYRALVGAAAPVNLEQWVHAPVNFQAWYFIQTFCLIFPTNGQILHPSIEIFNPDTTFLSDFSY